MSMEYIRRAYNVPAKRGGRVRLHLGNRSSLMGRITSSRGPYLCVQFDGFSKAPLILHPTWCIEYIPEIKR